MDDENKTGSIKISYLAKSMQICAVKIQERLKKKNRDVGLFPYLHNIEYTNACILPYLSYDSKRSLWHRIFFQSLPRKEYCF